MSAIGQRNPLQFEFLTDFWCLLASIDVAWGCSILPMLQSCGRPTIRITIGWKRLKDPNVFQWHSHSSGAYELSDRKRTMALLVDDMQAVHTARKSVRAAFLPCHRSASTLQ